MYRALVQFPAIRKLVLCVYNPSMREVEAEDQRSMSSSSIGDTVSKTTKTKPDENVETIIQS